MTYTVILDALSVDTHAHAIGVSVAAALNGTVVTDPPSWHKVRASLDAALIAPLDGHAAADNSPDQIMLRALGLR